MIGDLTPRLKKLNRKTLNCNVFNVPFRTGSIATGIRKCTPLQLRTFPVCVINLSHDYKFDSNQEGADPTDCRLFRLPFSHFPSFGTIFRGSSFVNIFKDFLAVLVILINFFRFQYCFQLSHADLEKVRGWQ